MKANRIVLGAAAAFAALVAPALTLAQSAFPASTVYVKEMKVKINALWQSYAYQKPQSVTPSKVKISFRLNADGTVQNIRVPSNTSNQFLADISIKAIKNAKLSPFPQSVIREQGHPWADVRDMEFTAPESWRR
jgi:FlaG/FlaF family flagellin (archaellin)